MTKWAIVDKENIIVDFKEYKPEIHSDFRLYEVGDEVDNTYEFNSSTETFSVPTKPVVDHQFARMGAYPELNEQLGMLWHDIDSGLLGETAKSGQFYQTIKKTKDALAKGRKDITVEEMEAIMLENGVLKEQQEVPSGS